MRKKKQSLKKVDAPDYSYWQALYMAFYSPRLYIDVVKRWHGFGMGYFLLLMLLVSIPWSIQYSRQFAQYVNDELIYPISNIPLLLVQNGEVSIDQPMPYLIKNKAGNVAIMIDTTREYYGLPAEYPNLSFLIGKNKFFFKAPLGQFFSQLVYAKKSPTTKPKVSEHYFDPADNEVFSGREWVKTSGIQSLAKYSIVFAFPVVLGVLFGLYFVTNFILSSFGRIVSIVILKYKIAFKSSFRLTWVASTAPLFFLNIEQFFGFNIPGAGLYYIALVAFYFLFAIIAVRRESQYLVHG